MNSKRKTSDLVLVVDDSADTLGMLNDALEQAGMTTLVALEGRQALSIAHKITPDIILMDAIMPVMDGFETCRHLKADAELKSIPVIFMTGLTETEDIVRGFEAGGVDYVTKPIKTLELITRIKVHLSNARVTLSAQTALDTAGQNICAVNHEGELQWATPQVGQLLDNSLLQGWDDELIKTALIGWRHTGSPTPLTLPNSRLPLKLLYVGEANDNEYLLRLLNENQPNEIDQLKTALPVTGREAEVLLWVAKGKTNREIALILELSPRTVNKHLEQSFKKIGVENRTSAATLAVAVLQKNRGY